MSPSLLYHLSATPWPPLGHPLRRPILTTWKGIIGGVGVLRCVLYLSKLPYAFKIERGIASSMNDEANCSTSERSSKRRREMSKNKLTTMIMLCVMTIPCLADTRTRATTQGGVEEGSRSGKITICRRAKSDNFWETIAVSRK